VPRSTVGRVLVRYRMPLLAHIDQATGLAVRNPKPTRYEASAPGELVHVDITKLGRIPEGGGWRIYGRGSTQDKRAHVAHTRAHRAGAPGSRGYVFLHHTVDDYSRFAYSEQLPDEKNETAASFCHRAQQFFTQTGIAVSAVMTDNGSCYRSHDFAQALGPGVKHRRTRPYRPETNGKVERFDRTLVGEWTCAQTYLSDAARAATYAEWLHSYNHHRPHAGIGGLVPADCARNVMRDYS
jgi:transposase InsO family protein